MFGLLLTQNTTPIFKWVVQLLGMIMNGIFNFFDMIGIPNTALTITFFTIIVYLIMMPMTIKSQKFSKLNAKMSPEIQAINAKYKNRKDNDSMMAMNAETKAVYAKYGVSPSGGCLQMVIQMPIIFALYRVIYSAPAYVTKMKEAYLIVVSSLIGQTGSAEYLQNTENFSNAAQFAKQFKNDLFVNGDTEYIQNTFIDVLNKASTAEWDALALSFPELSGKIVEALDTLNRYNNLLGINISNSPKIVLAEAWADKSWLLMIGALLFPILSALTQWINVKLAPQAAPNDNASSQQNSMNSYMKSMNMFMPLVSAYFSFILPCGMSLYWIVGAVVRAIQQVAINKHLDRMDIDAQIKHNEAKFKEKQKKQNVYKAAINEKANQNTKTLDVAKKESTSVLVEPKAKPASGSSIAARANMVKEFNEKNNK